MRLEDQTACNQESIRSSQIGWTEDFCLHLDVFAAEDHSYRTTWCDRAPTRKTVGYEFEKPRKCCNSNSITCRLCRAVAKSLKLTHGRVQSRHKLDPRNRPDRQISQRQGQQFQQHHEPPTSHVAPSASDPNFFKDGKCPSMSKHDLAQHCIFPSSSVCACVQTSRKRCEPVADLHGGR